MPVWFNCVHGMLLSEMAPYTPLWRWAARFDKDFTSFLVLYLTATRIAEYEGENKKSHAFSGMGRKKPHGMVSP